MESKMLSRRSLFKFAGVGMVGSMVTVQALARACGIKTAEQDLGPFFPRPGTPEDEIHEDPQANMPIYLANDNDLTQIKGRKGTASGQVVYVRGQVTDESCKPVAGATIIVWQASQSGRYNHKGDADNQDFIHPKTGAVVKRTLDPFFQSWGKAVTDANGEYFFKTIIPGFYPADLSTQWYRPPHIHFMVSATGFPQFVTQMYFKGDQVVDNEYIQELNHADLILQGPKLSEEEKQNLIVEFVAGAKASDGMEGTFDIVLKR